jgi:hypothetical protein
LITILAGMRAVEVIRTGPGKKHKVRGVFREERLESSYLPLQILMRPEKNTAKEKLSRTPNVA